MMSGIAVGLVLIFILMWTLIGVIFMLTVRRRVTSMRGRRRSWLAGTTDSPYYNSGSSCSGGSSCGGGSN